MTSNDPTLDVLVGATEAPTGSDYAELRRIIKDQGLLNRQPAYYAYKIIFTLGLLAASIAFLVIVDNFWWQLLNAAFLALVFGQLGFVGHDAGHRGIFKSARWNEMAGLGINLLISLSRSWWVTQAGLSTSTRKARNCRENRGDRRLTRSGLRPLWDFTAVRVGSVYVVAQSVCRRARGSERRSQ